MSKVRWTEKDLAKFNIKLPEKEKVCQSFQIRVNTALPSFNQVYAGKHWTERHKQSSHIKALLKEFLAPFKDHHLPKFIVELRYNSGLDPDNTIYAVKLFVDVIRKMGIVTNDSKKYFRGLSVLPDEELPDNTYIFKVIPV